MRWVVSFVWSLVTFDHVERERDCRVQLLPAFIRHQKAAHSAGGGKYCPALQTRVSVVLNLHGWGSGSVQVAGECFCIC